MQWLIRVYGRGAPASRLRNCGCFHAASSPLFPLRPVINRRYSTFLRTFTCDKGNANSGPRNNRYKPFSGSVRFRYLFPLSAAASVPLNYKNSKDDFDYKDDVDLTLEQSLLDTSEEERLDQLYEINPDRSTFYRFFKRIKIAFLKYVFEPIATTLRFIQLVIIFVPVFATIPLIFIGQRDPEAYNERTGTLWWYRFLVKQMERAGPTFIKVSVLNQWSDNLAWTMGCVEN